MKLSVFVPDAHTRASIAVIRSLGRAGYNIHAASSDHTALGLKSRFADQSVVHPDFFDSSFVGWMRDYTKKHDIKMIIPTSSILMALRQVFDEFKPLLPVTENESVLFDCFSKTSVVQKFINADPELGLMRNHPRSTVVDLTKFLDSAELPSSQSGYYIKAEKIRPQGSETEVSFAFVESAEKALSVLSEMASDWEAALVQEACSGFQIGVSVLMHNGRALAVSCVRDCHEHPHSRGTMSLRQSCWFPEVADDAINRLANLNWQGCAMGEYRYDEETKRFNLIEINFRYWQYLHLDIFAGMDYPLMQAQWFLDGKTHFENIATLGVVCRDTWPGEVAQLVNESRRNDIHLRSKGWSFLMFIFRFFDPRIRSDFLFPGDYALYFLNLVIYIKTEFKSLLSRFRKSFGLS